MFRTFLIASLTLTACATSSDPTNSGVHCPSPPMCVVGQGTCLSSNQIETCILSAVNGCAVLSDKTCTSGQTCHNGVCSAPCSDDCQPPDAKCSGDLAQTCDTGSDGCFHWSAPTACPAGQKCGGGQCAVGGGVFAITFQSATIPATRPDGSAWDALGGDPDPKVAIIVNGANMGVTLAQSNTLKPIWNQTLDVSLQPGDALGFQVVDEDVTVDDLIDSTTFSSWESLLTNGGQHSGALHAGSKVTLKWVIAPK